MGSGCFPMNTLTADFLAQLTGEHNLPCLSLYQPTHRRHPESKQDPIRYRSLLKEMELQLKEKYSQDQITTLMEPFEALGLDEDFWNHTQDGLAVFGAPGHFSVVGLSCTVQELVVVADTFHTKPLRSFLQSTDRYQILSLNQHDIKLYEGSRNSLEVIQIAAGSPRTINEALGEELTEPTRTTNSAGGIGGGSVALHHSHGTKDDEVDIDADRYFRAVDRMVLDVYSRPSGLPLLLVALPEHHHLFHQVSHNPFLLAEGLKINAEGLSHEELRDRAWEIFEPQYEARLTSLADDFQVAKSQGLGLDDLSEVAKAAVAARIATLLIEADREVVGRIHPGTGNVDFSDPDHPLTDDLLDDLGEWVVKLGGTVMVIPAALMPTQTGAAAICRY